MGGCAHKPAPRQTGPARRPNPPGAAAQAPEGVVKAYLRALDDKDYQAAYDRLTSQSRFRNGFDEFRKSAQQGAFAYDFDRITVESPGAGQAAVSVGIAEDVGFQRFMLRREAGQWRVVFFSGSPWAPESE